KYKLHYVIVLPAMLLIFVFKIIPLLGSFYLAFIQYQPFRGWFGSPWVGMANFSKLLEHPALHIVIGNTIAMKLGYMFLAGGISFVLALAVSAIQHRWLRHT